MRKRLVIGGVLVATTVGLSIPAMAASSRPAHTTSVPPACIVVHGPGGLTLQVGYAPNGPSDCHTF